MKSKQSKAAVSRVTALLNAISDLHENDLIEVLELDKYLPMQEFGENDLFCLKPDGIISVTPGFPPPPRSLVSRLESGNAFAKILEQQLDAILIYGESQVVSDKKRRRRKVEFGGRRFIGGLYD